MIGMIKLPYTLTPPLKNTPLPSQVLSVRKAAVIEATIAQLPAELLRPLLAALVQRAQSQPARAMELTQWLQALLTTHTSYFLALPQLHVMLAPLYQVRAGGYARLCLGVFLRV
jgi:ribosomal protein L17